MSKAFRLLEIIRKNTDKDHPMTQDAIRKLLGEKHSKEILGDKGTYARRLKEIADAYNTDIDDNPLPKEERRLVYPGYDRPENSNTKNGKVYYNHPVSEEEFVFIIKSIRESREFSSEDKADLEKRILDTLGSRYYDCDRNYGFIIDLDRDKPEYSDALEQNIIELRGFISSKMMTDITVILEEGKKRTKEYQVSPYRIIKKDGYYWLIANWHERPADTYDYYGYRSKYPWFVNCLSAYRIDLIELIQKGYVPDETTVHFAMNPKYLNYDAGYRLNRGNERKARFNTYINDRLSEIDKNPESLVLEHCKDIEFRRQE